MQTIIETEIYLRSVKNANMTQSEQEHAINYIAEHPKEGDLIVGSKGLRKIRIARDGKGKSGGYRVIYYYHNEDKPVILLMAYAKNQMSNLSEAMVKKLIKILEGE